MAKKRVKKDKNIREKLLASFSVGVGFWLINISHTYSSVWVGTTAIISALAFIFLLFFSIKAIKQKEKILGWTFLLMDIIMILSRITPEIIGFFD
ncbi:MAG: hypothetical protein Q7S06_03170 [Nanoarchaeota archaeon]|nr:hypothetical protein [Nanoarchaeota archaeon]